MDLLQSQSQMQLQRDGFSETKPNDHVGTAVPAKSFSESVSSGHALAESRTLQGETEFPSSQDPEKVATKLTGKYAKYAGDPPDGGLKGWSVILASALACCATLGYINTWGVFQAYYETVVLPNNSPSDIAWIGSIQYTLIFFPGLFVGRLFDIGHFKIPFFVASCFLVICTFLIAECKVYWQFFLAHGLGIGLSSGILFSPAIGVVSHWFSKRSGLALGLSAIGSSVGGTAFPIAAQNLLPEVGFKWTMRIFGFIFILVLGVTNILMDRRLPPTNARGGMFNWAALKNPAYAVYCASGLTTFLGLYTALTYLPLSAVQVGVPTNFAFYYIAIANGCSAFGRLSAGFLADRIGAINVMAPFTAVAAIMTFAWPFAKSQDTLVAVSVIYGFSCGTYVSLIPAPVMAMGATGDVGRRTGLFFSFAALGALAGPPISGAINSATGGFEAVGYFAGGILILSVCLLLTARYLHLGQLVGRF